MGFFSELKEDLSTTVDGQAEAQDLGMEAAADMLAVQEAAANAAPESTEDLSKMLDQMNLDEIIGEDVKTEESAEAAEDTAAETVDDTFKTEKLFSTPAASSHVADETAIVTSGMSIKGDINSQGSLEVVGTVQGNIDIMGKLNVSGSITGNSKAAEFYTEKARITGEVHSEGSLKIGQNSIIIGNIYGTSAVIAGAVKGDIDVHGPVILDATAIVMGDIKSKSVQINNGAVIEGMCSQCYADVSPTSFFDNLTGPTKKSGKKS